MRTALIRSARWVFTLTVVAGALLIALAFVGVAALVLDPDSFGDGNWGGPLIAVLSAIIATIGIAAIAVGLLGRAALKRAEEQRPPLTRAARAMAITLGAVAVFATIVAGSLVARSDIIGSSPVAPLALACFALLCGSLVVAAVVSPSRALTAGCAIIVVGSGLAAGLVVTADLAAGSLDATRSQNVADAEAFAPSVPGLLGARAGAWTVVTAGTVAEAPTSSGVGWFERQEGVGIAFGGWPDPPGLAPGSRLYGLVACRGGTSGLTLEQSYAWDSDDVDGSRVFPDDTFFETGPMPCDGTPHGAALVGDAPSVPVEAVGGVESSLSLYAGDDLDEVGGTAVRYVLLAAPVQAADPSAQELATLVEALGRLR
jgi:hypothetical protein